MYLFHFRSAPDQKDVFTLHVRTLGGWTKRLHAYFTEEERLMNLENSRMKINPNEVYKKSVKKKFSNFFTNVLTTTEEQYVAMSNSVSPKVSFTQSRDQTLADAFNIIFSNTKEPMGAQGKYLKHHPKVVNFNSKSEVEQGSPFQIQRLKTAHSKSR